MSYSSGLPGRYAVIWEGVLAIRWLRDFLPGGVPRWTKQREKARIYASAADAEHAATAARKAMRNIGIKADVQAIKR